jgi:hypothetical protein
MKSTFLILIVFSCFFSGASALNDPPLIDLASNNALEGVRTFKTEDLRFSFRRVILDEQLAALPPVNGFFSAEVEKKYHLLNESYTQEVPMGPGSLSTRTVVRKPVIYSSLNKMYKHFRTEARKGRMSTSDAQLAWNHILEVSLTLLYSSSESFEAELRDRKELSEKIDLFLTVQLTD